MSVLELTGVEASYGRHTALRGVSLDIEEGELHVILGPTGAGKTTLLRTIAGLHTPSAGSIRIQGEDVASLPPSGRDVAMVFQNFSLYPDRTVRENLAFPLKAPISTVSATETEKRVAETSEMLRITHLLDKPATQLSGGEMQRVAIGRAIVRRPRLFLFDEPLTNLDAKLREQLRVEIISLQKRLGVPAVYVTHDQAEALSMADRVSVLDDGQIVQTGSPEEIYTKPTTPSIARQLGYPSINLLDVESSAGHWIGKSGDPIVQASGTANRATIGIRPENIRATGGRASGTIRVVEDIGPSRILLVEWAGHEIRILENRIGRRSPGEEVSPSVSPDHVIEWPTEQEG